MDQGAIAEPGGRRTWTPLRAMLIALGAVAGGILLSVALGGPAHADTPDSPSRPAATSSGTSLVDRVSGALTGVTGAVVAPVDHVVTTTVTAVLPTRAAPPPAATPSRPAPTAPVARAPLAPVTAAVSELPAALDGALAQVPIATTPLWQGVLGPHPVESLTSPLAVTLRPVAPGVVDLLAPTSAVTVATAAAAASATERAVAPAAPASAAAAGFPAPASHADTSGVTARPDAAPPMPGPAAPSGAVDGMLVSVPTASATGAALLIAAFAILLLVATTARRRGWTLPAAPVFGADVSPD
ncbi:hypothetical protein [Pseudolysinimonas sp.]|uniref:hypothetical protein n=1 Tax=Pseudolysinimonas sp. TaxID=2680009 RepID=UPI003F7DF94A